MPKRQRRKPTDRTSHVEPTTLRVVGGSLRGRKIKYAGDLTVRPMKDRTREAVFNLIGPAIQGMHAVDLFAGTGAMAIEAISRGAKSATLIERHLPSAQIVRENLEALQLVERANLVRGNAFLWTGETEPDLPWCLFLCPPYSFFQNRLEQLHTLIERAYRVAPDGSLIVVEAEIPFDFAPFADLGDWDVRTYRPAVVGILEKIAGVDPSSPDTLE